ncbi:MAG: nuclear transport factor 2 family protein [Myxococcota bacterium]|nr:nuclear transport factor 2 family protein [Myxococcota bacterium]
MLYEKMNAALEARDAEAWHDLLHDDFEFVRHQSGSSMNKDETIAMMRAFMASDAVQEEGRRCLYENEDILVVHSFMDFADNTREAVLVVYTKKDGRLHRSETGATKLKG